MLKQLLLILTVVACAFVALPVQAQVADSVAIAKDSIALQKQNKKKIYSMARRAAIMSAVLPGLGQAYNKKYWKIPIIYAGLGGFGYMFVTNQQEYSFYRRNLIAEYDEDPATKNTTRYSGDQLKKLKDQFKKSRNLGFIGFCAIYLVNIIDANVDGHLRTFDVSDDLSFSVDPWQLPVAGNRLATGVSLTLTFK